MIHAQCPGCLVQAFLECSCPPDYILYNGRHGDGCSHAGIDANVTCDPASTHPDCCHLDHDHAAAANACTGSHAGQPCPHPEHECRAWADMIAGQLHPLYKGPSPGPCPGGHCAKGTDGCTVCRPLIITAMPGTTVVPAGA